MLDCVRIGTQGLIFVIDSSDKARIEEARQELHRIINDREMKESLLLVFANKQDIAGGMFPLPLSSLFPSFNYLRLLTPQSNETTRSNRRPQTKPTKRQNLVRRTKLRYNRRRITGRPGMLSPSSSPSPSPIFHFRY